MLRYVKVVSKPNRISENASLGEDVMQKLCFKLIPDMWRTFKKIISTNIQQIHKIS